MEKAVNYWKEEEGYDTFYTDYGFCAFMVGDSEFFIAHFYSEKGKSYEFWNKVKEEAKKLGCEYITANIDLNERNQKNYTKKLMIFLRHGCKVISITNNRVTVLKQL